ncbi:U5 small nuclear ribonucleoprotein, partial [Tetrabaena socialis]
VKKLGEHTAIVNSCCPLRRGTKMFVTGSDDNTARVWDMRVKKAVHTLRGSFPVMAVAYADDGEQIYSGGVDNTIKVSGCGEGSPRHVVSAEADSYFETNDSAENLPWIEVQLPRNVHVLNMHRYTFVHGHRRAGYYRARNFKTQIAAAPPSEGLTAATAAVGRGGSGPDALAVARGARAAASAQQQQLMLPGEGAACGPSRYVDVATRPRAQFLTPPRPQSMNLDGPFDLASGHVHNLAGPALVAHRHLHNFERNLLRCDYSADAAKVTCGSADRMVYVWDTSTRKLLYKLPGHSGSVNEVAFHPKEPIIGSASSDKTIFLGELAE